ncbi:MAG: RIP metalloprotease RseP [Gammaproteobacteria bacterium]|nr:RIP metalloprotease RseP [Gammaproteobacteria bacterium]
MSSVLSSIFFFILTLGILITFHEFGHYWVARKLGVKVLRFSVGFGSPIWKKTGKDADQVEYVIAAIPLGGYVKMLDERETEVPQEDLHRSFNRQSLATRTAIVAAGPIFNFLLAIVVYWFVFMLGVNGLKPIVGGVAVDSIAERGGFQKEDEILKVGDRDVEAWGDAILAILDEALNQQFTSIQVKTLEGAIVDRKLELTGLTAQLEQSDVLSFTGLSVYRPKIPPEIGQIESGAPAYKAGMERGDLVLSADGETISDWGAWVDYVRAKPDEMIVVDVDRDGVVLTLNLTPELFSGKEGEYGRIGAGVTLPPKEEGNAYVINQQYGPIDAMQQALGKTWDVSVLTLRMLYNMVFGDISVKNLSGPISIAQYAGGSASIGLIPFLMFLAVVSISLGVLNLLPVPMLDGGHLMYYFVELVKGSPVSEQTEMLGQRIGIMLLVVLMVFAFYNDLSRVFG